jgi:hypothetical protein
VPIIPVNPHWTHSQEQAAEGVSEPEEDEDDQGHHHGDQAHHREELGACLPIHDYTRALPARTSLPRGVGACIAEKVVGTGAQRHPGALACRGARALHR